MSLSWQVNIVNAVGLGASVRPIPEDPSPTDALALQAGAPPLELRQSNRMTLPQPFFCFPSDNTVFSRVNAAKQEATVAGKDRVTCWLFLKPT